MIIVKNLWSVASMKFYKMNWLQPVQQQSTRFSSCCLWIIITESSYVYSLALNPLQNCDSKLNSS